MKNNTSRELLQIQPTMLEDLGPDDNLSSGRFGTVCLKKFRSTPVAVKYLGSSSVKEVQREASFLDKCCHINLPIIFGVNTMQKPYFIVAEFYGNGSFKALTLRELLHKDEEHIKSYVNGPEYWLHLSFQITDSICYLHTMGVLHNDIKTDNIVVSVSPVNVITPILIDFSKATLISEGKIKVLTAAEKDRYRKEHMQIAPELIEGTHPQSVKSDIYSQGIVFARIYLNLLNTNP